MDGNRFDELTNTIGEAPTRRQAVKAIGGLAVAALAAASGLGLADARKKGKKGKKGKNKPRTCAPGTRVESVSVPATGATVTTPVLRQGQRYRLRAVGFWSTNAQFGNDAFAAFPYTNPNAPQTTYQGVRLGLSVDGGSPDQWGSYNPSHVYERRVVGQGAPLTLRFTDPVPADDSGTLTVDIFCD